MNCLVLLTLIHSWVTMILRIEPQEIMSSRESELIPLRMERAMRRPVDMNRSLMSE